MGIALCGSGNGISMTLNKHQGYPCGPLLDAHGGRARPQAQLDTNICSLPARFIDNTQAAAIVDAYLGAEFGGDVTSAG